MLTNTSKQALICNEREKLFADGVMMYKGNNTFRTYWLALALQFFVKKGKAEGLDIQGE